MVRQIFFYVYDYTWWKMIKIHLFIYFYRNLLIYLYFRLPHTSKALNHSIKSFLLVNMVREIFFSVYNGRKLNKYIYFIVLYNCRNIFTNYMCSSNNVSSHEQSFELPPHSIHQVSRRFFRYIMLNSLF